MKGRSFGIAGLLLIICALSGCTDFVEPNQLAFVMGTAIDPAEDGNMEVSYQMVLPTQKNSPIMGESAKDSGSFIVLSAKGRDIFEASQKIQTLTSRRLLTSHRVLVALSDAFLNKDDVRRLFDKLNRDPANNQRDQLVIIHGSAKQFLKLDHPMEHLSSIATGKEMQINGLKGFSTRQFIIDCISDGQRPLVPLVKISEIQLSQQMKKPLAALGGFVTMNKKLKIAGLLSESEGQDAVWMAGRGTFTGITIPWKEGRGVMSFRLTHLQRSISYAGGSDPGKFTLTVKAHGYLLENTTSFSTSDVDRMIEVESVLNERIAVRLQATLEKTQAAGTDIYGLGDYVHRTQPRWWKAHKDEWDERFKNVEITVKSGVRLRTVGTSGS